MGKGIQAEHGGLAELKMRIWREWGGWHLWHRVMERRKTEKELQRSSRSSLRHFSWILSLPCIGKTPWSQTKQNSWGKNKNRGTVKLVTTRAHIDRRKYFSFDRSEEFFYSTGAELVTPWRLLQAHPTKLMNKPTRIKLMQVT